MSAKLLRAVCLTGVCGMLAPPIGAQHKVERRNRYERLLCIVPMTGGGTWSDPKRPLYAPVVASNATASRQGMFSYTFRMADDQQHAIMMFVPLDRKAFAPLLQDSRVIACEPGKVTAASVEALCKSYMASFDGTLFGPGVN